MTTGVCLICWGARQERVFCEQTDVTFHRLTAAQIRRYQEKVNPLDKAGAYGIQESGGELVESIFGSYTNVVGLPLERLGAELEVFEAGSPGGFSNGFRCASIAAAGGLRRVGARPAVS